MLIPTTEQRDQIEAFFYLITRDFNSILLHPVIDEKTGAERLAICIVDRHGPNDNKIYMLGLWFLPNDKLFNRFSFKESESRIVTEKPNGVLKCLKRMIRRSLHLFN